MDKFFAALRFLTIIPIPGDSGTSEDSLAGSLPYFPLVGITVGLLMAVTGKFALQIFPEWAAAVLMVFALFAISGGLHLDGLADCADGFFSARPRERVLEIMRDSNVGVMGVLALIITILLKTVCLAGMDSERFLISIFMMALAGRCLMPVSMAIMPYIRKDGLGVLFYRDKANLKKTALWSLAILYSGSWYAGGQKGLIAGGASLVVLLFFAAYCKKKIGGASGDTFGAGCELSEIAVVLTLASI